jgi:lipopolysaccharide transport system permease protein
MAKYAQVFSHGTDLALQLGWQDVKQAYRRSAIGPFWVTLGIGIQIAVIGAVFGLIFRASLSDFLPFLAVSIILWTYMSSSINDGSMAYVAGTEIIRQTSIPHYVHLLRVLWKNLILLVHNAVILPIVFVVFLKPPSWSLLLVFPSIIVTSLFLYSMSVTLATITTRYRDMQQIINSGITVLFYVTPVIWQPNLIPPGTAHLLLGLNPVYHFLQLMRLPILGEFPTLENWGVCIVATALAGALGYKVTQKYKHSLAYWV